MKKKEKILQAATYLFSRKGFRETSMAELSRMTGAAEGTIFYHFRTKQDIFLTILRNLKDDILPEFERYKLEKSFPTGLDMVEGALSFYLYMAGIKEDLFAILHQRYPYELAEASPECRAILESVYEGFVDIFEQAVLTGKRDGSIGDVPARKSAMILFSLADSLVRFRMYQLYDVGALYNEVIASCRRMLERVSE